jgi:hypothetical protein
MLLLIEDSQPRLLLMLLSGPMVELELRALHRLFTADARCCCILSPGYVLEIPLDRCPLLLLLLLPVEDRDELPLLPDEELLFPPNTRKREGMVIVNLI